MNLNNIKPGMRIKNYRELCRLMDIPIKTGEAKIKQLKEINEYITYDKDKYAFIIKTINDKKILHQEYIPPRNLQYKNSKRIYSKYIQHILLQYLSTNTTKGIIYMNKIDLYRILGFVNKNFGSSKAEKEFLNIFNNITMEELNVVKTQAFAKMNSILKSALNSLRSKRLISYFTEVTIEEKNGSTRTATDEEIQKIDSIEHNILKELGCSHIWQIYEKRLYNVFYEKVHNEMELEGWINYQRKLKIIFTNEYVIEELNKIELELEKIQLNEEIMTFLQNDLEKKHDKFHIENKPPAIGINQEYERILKKPENALFIIPKQECMDKYNQIAANFIRYIMC